MNLGIVCGYGNIPFIVATHASQKYNITLFILENIADDKRLENFKYYRIGIGKFGKFLSILKKDNIQDIVMIGGVKIGNIKSLKVDFRGLALLLKIITAKNRGDDGVLRIIKNDIKKHKINIVGAHDVAPNIKETSNLITRMKPNIIQKQNIQNGIEALKILSILDVGQSLVVGEGKIIAIEGIEGTDELIKRCSSYRDKYSEKPILVKMPKINQDNTLDMPTIGIQTIKLLQANDFSGIAISRHCVIIENQDECQKIADETKMFIHIFDL